MANVEQYPANERMASNWAFHSVLDIVLIAFIVLKTSNVAILYFAPSSRIGNGVAVFDRWKKLQKGPASALFVRYFVNWVAGTKLIFILLIAAIFAMGNEPLKLAAAGAMAISIASYHLRLHPLIKMLDNMGEIAPKEVLQSHLRNDHGLHRHVRHSHRSRGAALTKPQSFPHVALRACADQRSRDNRRSGEICRHEKRVEIIRPDEVDDRMGCAFERLEPIETVLAEKLETVVSRGIANTRGRDFYDIRTLLRLKSEDIDRRLLREAVAAPPYAAGPGFEDVLRCCRTTSSFHVALLPPDSGRQA